VLVLYIKVEVHTWEIQNTKSIQ